MQYFKPWTTLLLGVAIGYFVGPKIVSKVR